MFFFIKRIYFTQWHATKCSGAISLSVGVSWRHLSVLDTILDLIPKPAVCGREIQCRKQGIVAAVHVPADLQEHGAVYVHGI